MGRPKKFKISSGSSSNSSSRDPDIPQDLIDEHILHRLPVKSLLRFKCVSTHWCSLISSPAFAKKHLQHSSNSATRSFFLQTRQEWREGINKFFNIQFELESHEQAADGHKIGPSNLELSRFYHGFDHRMEMPQFLLGACNGLVCIQFGPKTEERYCPEGLQLFFLICNPMTKEKHMTKSPYISYKYEILPSAFEYDSSSDDYKIVLLYRIWPYSMGPTQFHVYIYSLRTTHWKKLATSWAATFSIYNFYILKPPVYFNGTLDWLLLGDSSLVSRIVTFDLARETFSTIHLPSKEGGINGSLIGARGFQCVPIGYNATVAMSGFLFICVIGQSLCACFVHNKNNTSINMDVWKLEYHKEGKDCWTPLFQFRDWHFSLNIWNHNLYQNLFEFVHQEDLVLMSISQQLRHLVLIDKQQSPSKYTLGAAGSSLENLSFLTRAHCYIEGLTSPHYGARAPRS